MLGQLIFSAFRAKMEHLGIRCAINGPGSNQLHSKPERVTMIGKWTDRDLKLLLHFVINTMTYDCLPR